MKHIFILGVIILLTIGTYFLVNVVKTSDVVETTDTVVSSDTTNNTVTLSGTVTKVNLDEMAFDGPALITIKDNKDDVYTIAIPSMGLPLCDARERIASVGSIEIGDNVEVTGELEASKRIVPCSDKGHHLSVEKTVVDDTLGYQFTYKKGPDGYVLIKDEEEHGEDFISGNVLFNRNEYESLLNSTAPREGPPGMHIRVYKNTDRLSAAVWVMKNPRESNIELALKDPVESVVGGANATNYLTDGLFPTSTYVIASGGYIYVLMGAYPDTQSTIYADFKSLVSSFTFIMTTEIPDDVREHIDSKSNLIRVTNPLPMSEVTNPLLIAGMARGQWFFEASFPVTVTDWDGRIIGEGIATADGEWMTEEFVSFSGEINFSIPVQTPYKRGTIIFRKDNPSGLPEHDDALEFPVRFE